MKRIIFSGLPGTGKSTLAERQLQLGQSVILDSVAGTHSIRDIWKALAEQYQAGWRVIECTCSEVVEYCE